MGRGASAGWLRPGRRLVVDRGEARPPRRRGARRGGTVDPTILGDGPGVGARRAGGGVLALRGSGALGPGHRRRRRRRSCSTRASTWCASTSPLSTPFDRQVLNEFSADRRAALADNGGTLFGLKFVPTALVQYLRPDTIEPRALLPWFSWAAPADLIGDVTFDTVDRSASLPVVAPVWLVAWVCGVVAIVRRRLAGCVAVSTGAAAVGVAADAGHRLHRAALPRRLRAVARRRCGLGVPVIAAWAAIEQAAADGVLVGAVILGVVGLVTNAGLAVLGTQPVPAAGCRRAAGLRGAQYAVHDVLGSGAPRRRSGRTARRRVGADGAIAVVGDCDAVYRSDGATWRLLELRPGGAPACRRRRIGDRAGRAR